MALRKKLKKAVKTVLKKRKVYPDMPADPKDLARAMFFPHDEKLKARRRAQEEERGRDSPRV